MPGEMIPFIDLKRNIRRSSARSTRRSQRVLDHGHFIMGPEVAEMEEALAAYAGAAPLHLRRERHRRAADQPDGAWASGRATR